MQLYVCQTCEGVFETELAIAGLASPHCHLCGVGTGIPFDESLQYANSRIKPEEDDEPEIDEADESDDGEE